MNRNDEFSDVHELLDEYLSHSGVKGMKWGVWNDETKRKYGLGSLKRSVLESKVAKKAGAAKADLTAKIKNKYEHDKGERKEARALRKEIGMKRNDFNKLRKETLKSHNPEVVAKGMHTLTDEELKDKIRRLQEEDKIAKMASKQKQDRYNAKKARNEAINANPLVSFGKDVVKDTVKDSLRTLGYDVLVTEGAKPVLSKKVTDWSNRAQKKLDDRYAERDKAEAAAKEKAQKRADADRKFQEQKEQRAVDARRAQSEDAIAKVHNVESNKAVFDEADRLRKERAAETERHNREAQTRETIDTINKQKVRSEEIAANRAKANEALRQAKILEQRINDDEMRRWRGV